MSGRWVPMNHGPHPPTSQQGSAPKSGTHILEMARWQQATWEMVKTQAERGLMNAGAQADVSDSEGARISEGS